MAVPWTSMPPYGGNELTAKYAARCFCKRVHYEVTSDPVASKLCHCARCMRLHGAPFEWVALFHKDAVRFATESTGFLRWYNSQEDLAFDDGERRQLPCTISCKHCGTLIADEGRNMFMAFPTLFDFGVDEGYPESFMPQSHIFCRTAALELHDTLPKFLDDNVSPASPGDFLRFIAPPLDGRGRKGHGGRVGVLGGSVDYAGAPYYAAMSALRVGAELLYLCTAEEATGPIKSYSPEPMVSPVYDTKLISDPSTSEEEQTAFVNRMVALLPRLHALCIGPGLGRQPAVLAAVGQVIEHARSRQLPLVIDADGLSLINRQPGLVKGYRECVLTPNAMEYRRLAEAVLGDGNADLPALCSELDGCAIMQKGAVDVVFATGRGFGEPIVCAEPGAPRRPGGLGDLLSGSLATILGWAAQAKQCPLQACISASTLVRKSCLVAYERKKRSLVAPDVIDELGASFEAMCPARL